MISVFEHAGYRDCAAIVRNTVCDPESEADLDNSSDYDQPIPQPETYPHVKLSPPSSPKLSKCVPSCDEYLLINPATANDLPESKNYGQFLAIRYGYDRKILLGQVHSQEALEPCNVSVVPMLSSKHKVSIRYY